MNEPNPADSLEQIKEELADLVSGAVGWHHEACQEEAGKILDRISAIVHE